MFDARKPVDIANSAIGIRCGAEPDIAALNLLHSFFVNHLILPCPALGRLILGSCPESRHIALSVLIYLRLVAGDLSPKLPSTLPAPMCLISVSSAICSRRNRTLARSERPLGFSLTHLRQAAAKLMYCSPSFSCRHARATYVSAYSCAAFLSAVPVEGLTLLPF